MPRKLPLILNVIDLESTAWKKPEDIPAGERADIIEIGIATLKLKEEPVLEEKFSILVKPTRSKISEFCTALTTITPEMVEKDGVEFRQALIILRREFKSKERTWASWGHFDLKMLQKQCTDFGIPYQIYLGRNHINLKNLYSLHNRLSYELGMAAALEREGIPLEGTHHRGHDDAFNIAKIAQRLFSGQPKKG